VLSFHQDQQQRQVDLSGLFNDVSRTVSGIKTILGASGPSIQRALTGTQDAPMPSSSGNSETGSAMPFSGLFGGSNVCFKTCGMEDIQAAARKAAEMFQSLKVCAVVITAVMVFSALLITAIVLLYVYKNRRNMFASTCCSSNCNSISESSSVHQQHRPLGNALPQSSFAKSVRIDETKKSHPTPDLIYGGALSTDLF